MGTNANRHRAGGPGPWAAVCVATVLAGCSSAPKEREGAAGSFAFWPQAPDEPRIQFVRSFEFSGEIEESKPGGWERLVFGEESAQAAAIQKPYGVEMRNGRIYVCDIRRPALTVLDLKSRQMRLIGVSGVNRLANPVDVAVADDGWIYVADNERRAVIVFDPRERYARTFGHTGMKPAGVAVHGDRLYVADMESQKVEILDRRSGETLGLIGSVGDEDGQFRLPLGVDTDRDGNVYVVDMMRCRIQKFSPDGTFVSAMGTMGDFAGSFARPKHMAVDRDGIVYVVDSTFNNVQMFNAEHELLMSFGAAGVFPGAMNLPVGICVSEEGVDLFQDEFHPGFEPLRLVLVTNQFGPQKVSVYALGKRREGYSVGDLAASAVAVSPGVGVNPAGAALQSAGDLPEPIDDEAPPPPPPGGGGR